MAGRALRYGGGAGRALGNPEHVKQAVLALDEADRAELTRARGRPERTHVQGRSVYVSVARPAPAGND